jgi:ribosomal protein L7/L12
MNTNYRLEEIIMFAIAISYTDSRGNDKVKAFLSHEATETAALGEAFTAMSKMTDAYTVRGWDVGVNDEMLLEAIKPSVIDGRKIEAIKIYRKLTGEGLKESKGFVDAHMNDWSDESDRLADYRAGRVT